VVQRHAARSLHYDFRLEVDGVLKSWAVPKGPSLNPTDKRLAIMVEDHPLDYRTFEGTIPKGNYGAGEVEIWDEGFYEPLHRTKGKTDNATLLEEIKKGSVKIVMHGKKLKGEFALVRMNSDKDENNWLLIKHNDDHAAKEEYNAENETSPSSKVSKKVEKKQTAKKQVIEKQTDKKQKMNSFSKPMLASSASEPFDGDEWIFEIKWDGYR